MYEKLGHIGTKQLTLTITRKFLFKNMYKNIKLICRTCDICIKNKTRIGNFKAPLSQLGPATRPLEIISLDTIGGFTGNNSRKKYLHLIIDHFTRYVFISTSKTQVAQDFIKLVKNVEKEGQIETLLTDQYAEINSKNFKKYLESKKINLIFTAVDCAFSNGLNERTSQILTNGIRCKIAENTNRSWTSIAEECVKEYNNTIHSSTSFTPQYLLKGIDESIIPRELNHNNKHNLENNRSIALQNSMKIHDQNKKYYDKNKININYNVGDNVYIQNSNKLNRNKLDPIRIGPYRIIEKKSNLIYVINTKFKKKESNLFHASKLIPYFRYPDPQLERGDVSLTSQT